MLRDRGLAHVKRLGQLVHGTVARPEQVEQGTAGRIGDRPEHVDARRLGAGRAAGRSSFGPAGVNGGGRLPALEPIEHAADAGGDDATPATPHDEADEQRFRTAEARVIEREPRSGGDGFERDADACVERSAFPRVFQPRRRSTVSTSQLTIPSHPLPGGARNWNRWPTFGWKSFFISHWPIASGSVIARQTLSIGCG